MTAPIFSAVPKAVFPVVASRQRCSAHAPSPTLNMRSDLPAFIFSVRGRTHPRHGADVARPWGHGCQQDIQQPPQTDQICTAGTLEVLSGAYKLLSERGWKPHTDRARGDTRIHALEALHKAAHGRGELPANVLQQVSVHLVSAAPSGHAEPRTVTDIEAAQMRCEEDVMAWFERAISAAATHCRQDC